MSILLFLRKRRRLNDSPKTTANKQNLGSKSQSRNVHWWNACYAGRVLGAKDPPKESSRLSPMLLTDMLQDLNVLVRAPWFRLRKRDELNPREAFKRRWRWVESGRINKNEMDEKWATRPSQHRFVCKSLAPWGAVGNWLCWSTWQARQGTGKAWARMGVGECGMLPWGTRLSP